MELVITIGKEFRCNHEQRLFFTIWRVAELRPLYFSSNTSCNLLFYMGRFYKILSEYGDRINNSIVGCRQYCSCNILLCAKTISVERLNMTRLNWTRVNNDVYGNPRYVVHYLDITPNKYRTADILKRYDMTVKWANKLGGRKYHNKQYGGGIVFQSYNLDETEHYIFKALDAENQKFVS